MFKGHVDHGKSTLMGRLLHDLQLISSRALDKMRKEATAIGKSSFALAWAMDQRADERERGVTVDVSTNYFETDKTRFTILDAPGHQDFIPNMIAGTSQADFAVLVIDASTNAFEAGLRGQTKEHALLARSMGIPRVVVAINKMDAAGWSEDRFNEIQQQISAFLTTAGFRRENLAFVPCSGLTGENVTHPMSRDKAPWYHGKNLVTALEASEPSQRRLREPLRFSVSNVVPSSSFVSVSGRVNAGSFQLGDQVLTMPAGETANVKTIESEGVSAPDYAVAGQIVTITLARIDPINLRAGDVLCDPSRSPLRNVNDFVVKALAFEPLMQSSTVDVLQGRLAADGRITELIELVGKDGGMSGDGQAKDGKRKTKNKPRFVKPGQVARMRVTLNLEKGIPLEAPDRIVLRADGVTVAAGMLENVGMR